jgi:hypothetical protein
MIDNLNVAMSLPQSHEATIVSVERLTQVHRTLTPLVLWAAVSQTLNGSTVYMSAMRFTDRVFVVASQYRTYGTLLAASVSEHPDGTAAAAVRTLLGGRADSEADDTGTALIASRLALACHSRFRLPLLLGVGLPSVGLAEARLLLPAAEALLDAVSPPPA